MKQLLMIAASLLVSASALAYKDGTYNCKNLPGLPDNVYKIETQSVGGASLPYVDIHRFYHPGDSETKVMDSHIRGFAVVVSDESAKQETFLVGALRLEFDGDVLYNCK